MMQHPSFDTPLIVTPLGDGRRWELVEPFRYHVSDEAIEVPKGFATDFASIPRLFWNILPPWGDYGKAAVLHDWLYYTGQRSRVVCDAILMEAMEYLGVECLPRYAIYTGVRLGGWAAWRAHRRSDVNVPS